MAVYADGMRKVASCAAIFWHGAGLFVLWYKEVGHHAYRTTLYSIRTPQNIKLWPIPHITHPKIKYFWRPRTTTHPPKRYFSARAHHSVLVNICKSLKSGSIYCSQPIPILGRIKSVLIVSEPPSLLAICVTAPPAITPRCSSPRCSSPRCSSPRCCPPWRCRCLGCEPWRPGLC